MHDAHMCQKFKHHMHMILDAIINVKYENYWCVSCMMIPAWFPVKIHSMIMIVHDCIPEEGGGGGRGHAQ